MAEIKFKLSPDSIEKAIKELRKQKKTLHEKLELLRNRVAEELLREVETGFNGAIYNDILLEGKSVPNVDVSLESDGNVTFVVAYGEEAVFAEFGAGVYYNPGGSAHPNRPVGIVEIGEYGKGYGKRKVWGYYDESGDLKLTHGTPASMPMYHAARRVAEMVPELAREIFKGG